MALLPPGVGFGHPAVQVDDIRMPGDLGIGGENLGQFLLSGRLVPVIRRRNHRRQDIDERDRNEAADVLFDQADIEVGILPDFEAVLRHELFGQGLLFIRGKRIVFAEKTLVCGIRFPVALHALHQFRIEGGASQRTVGKIHPHGFPVIEERIIGTFDGNRQKSVLGRFSLHLKSTAGDNRAIDGHPSYLVHDVNGCAVSRGVASCHDIFRLVSGTGKRSSRG